MIMTDVNATIKPPAGFTLHEVCAFGEYIRLQYVLSNIFKTGTRDVIGATIIYVYVNSMGREVIRTEEVQRFPETPIKAPEPNRTWWNTLKNGFFMILIGTEEMIQCLRM